MVKTQPVFLSNFYKLFADRITVPRLAVLGMLLALLVAIKYAFGFVPGVEAVTFIFIVYALFLPPLDLIFLVIAFNLIVNVMYGWGTWFLIYWIVWPLVIICTRVLAYYTHSRFIMAGFAFLAGFSLLFWYFLSDWLFFGWNFAFLNVFTGLPIGLIEGLVTLFLVITLAPSLLRVINIFRPRFWPNQRAFVFKPYNERWKNWFRALTTGSAIIAAGGAASLFVFNSAFTELRQQYTAVMPTLQELKDRTSAPNNFFAVKDYKVLSPDEFNQFLTKPTEGVTPLSGARTLGVGEVAIVVIAGGEKHVEIVKPSSPRATMRDLLLNLKTLEFDLINTLFGAIVGQFRLKGETNWRHGTNNQKVNNSNFAILAGNGYFLQAGVSDTKVYGDYSTPQDLRSVFEITYDV